MMKFKKVKKELKKGLDDGVRRSKHDRWAFEGEAASHFWYIVYVQSACTVYSTRKTNNQYKRQQDKYSDITDGLISIELMTQ